MSIPTEKIKELSEMVITTEKMKELLLEQESAIAQIFSLHDEYLKSNKDRRSKPEYYNRIRNSLDNWYNTLTLNNLVLKSSEDKTHEYFVKNYYDVTKNKYLKALQLIQEHMPQPIDTPTTSSTPTGQQPIAFTSDPTETTTINPSHMQNPSTLPPPTTRTMEKQQERKDRITKMIRKLVANNQIIRSTIARIMSDTFETVEEVDYAINTIQVKMDDIAILHSEIYSVADLADVHGYDFNDFNQLDQDVSRVIQSLIRSKAKMSKPSTTNIHERSMWSSCATDLVQLPKMDIPSFDGEIMNWPKFRDLFIDLIHQSSLSEAYKFNFLKIKLVGKAASMISVINSNKDNYEAAWSRIMEKYDNKKSIIFDVYERLFHQKSVKENNSVALHEFINVSKECLSILNVYDISFENGESAILFLLLQKLDSQTRLFYELSLKDPKSIPKLTDFFQFLEIRAQALQTCTKNNNNKSLNHISSENSKQSDKCICCNEDSHSRLRDCPKFKALSVQNRRILVKEKGLCFNCLKSGHLVLNCSWNGCPITGCSSKHNSMLHLRNLAKENGQTLQINEINEKTEEKSGDIAFKSDNTNCSNASLNSKEDKFIFLGTAMIYIDDDKGNKILCRALLDSGSQVNIMTKDMWKKLRLQSKSIKTTLDGIGHNSITTTSRVCFNMFSTNLKFNQKVEALVLPQITKYLPSETINIPNKINDSYNLADPKFNKPDSIDVLLGAEVCMEVIQYNKVSLGEGLPFMKETELGWVIMGKFVRQNKSSSNCCGITSEEQDFQLNAPTLWEMEDVPREQRNVTIEEEMAELHFKNNTFRNSTGKFVVSLPTFKDISIGQSFDIALRRFKYLEKRLQNDQTLFVEYKKFLDEYLELNHMEEIQYQNIPKLHCFLPHHPVLKISSSTTKLRVVFDASSKTSNNVSLNDMLLTGPSIQNDVFSILLKFRLHKFAICADIEKMFRQILLNENDQHLQLIIWRNNPSENLKFFKLKTVTYGTTTAPFLATRCLEELARQNYVNFPKASQTIRSSFYVDDLVTGFDSLTEAKQVQREIINIMDSAGLHLRKWWSNHPSLIESLPSSDSEMEINFKNHLESVKTLGVKWNPHSDKLMLSIPDLENQTIFTKRIISAESGQIFDPLGVVNPSIVIAKLLIQKLWVLKIDWDSPLPNDINESWLNFRSQVNLLRNISVERFVFSENYQNIQLHGFADASKNAYGAVLYVRSIDYNGAIHVKLFCSKSKVSPVTYSKPENKPCPKDQETISYTIPKLELSAAKLLSELAERVTKTIPIKFDSTYLWSDSKIVLCWLRKNPSSFTRFVSNRIKFIQNVTNLKDWHHISGDDNPADIISRGMMPKDLTESALWFNGPHFLQKGENEWPIEENPDTGNVDNTIFHTLNISEPTTHFLDTINHRNSFTFLVHVLAFVFRFIKLARNKRNSPSNIMLKTPVPYLSLKPLSSIELRQTEFNIFKILQHQFEMHKEIDTSFKKLTPFIDDNGIIRVGGRLRNSNLPYETKHPILLPQCWITTLLVTRIHIENLHVAPLSLLSITRQNYWPVNGTRLCSRIFRHCIYCFKSKPRDIHQIMGQLPSARVTLSAPFAHTGVDFAGPFTIHHCLRGKKPTKVYLCVFICFIIKAVHLELVSDLSTAAFLAAFKRFISRRGRPCKMYSDNATNFIGAKNELLELHNFFQTNVNTFYEFAASKGISWETIPPRSPHFGGLWEAGVRRAKYHLTSILKDSKFTYEELNTVIVEIEYILNSRPLTAIPNNPNDLCALTPNHFLIQGNCSGLDEKDISDKKNYMIRRFEGISKIRQEFWSRFSKEYLVTLQQKTKWLKDTENIKENTPVLLKDSCMYPLRWQMGVIDKIYKGSDNKVRVVDVRTNNGSFRRAITHVSPFPDIDEFKSDLKPQIVDQNKENEKINSIEKNKPKLTSNRLSRPSKLNLTLTLLYSLLLLPLIFASNTKITKFNNHPGIYFDGISKVNILVNRWHIVTYFNVTEHFNQFSNLSIMLDSVRPLCKDYSCQSTILQIENRIIEIGEMNELLRDECQLREVMKINMLSRRRRSAIFPQLNLLGNIANAFTGVLDHTYAEKMETVIENVRQNEGHNLMLLKNHTMVLENTINLIKANNNEVMAKFENIQFELALSKTVQNKNIEKTYFNSMIAYITLVILKYREIQLQLHKSLTEFKSGKLNAVLINPKELQKHLVTIQQRLVQYKLPSTNFAELEPITQVAVTYGSTCLIFHIELPLINQHDFHLYRMLPVPTYKGHKFMFINPEVDYLAINLHQNSYYLMSSSEFQKCVDFIDLKMCYEHQPIFPTDQDNHCEVNMFLNNYKITDRCNVQYGLHPQYWIELQKENNWLYAVKDRTLIKTICSESIDQFETNILEGEGILEIPNGCTLDINGAKIHAKTITQSELIMKRIPPMLPLLNISSEIIRRNTTNPMILKLNDMSSVSSAIQGLKAEESVTLASLEAVSDGADIHTWITYGLFMILLLIVISYILARKYCCNKTLTIKQEISKVNRFGTTASAFNLPEGFGET